MRTRAVRDGITLLHLPAEDMYGVDSEHLERGIRFTVDHLDRGERVLVHCQHGIGRSAVLALCVLVQRDDAPLQALGLMRIVGHSFHRRRCSSHAGPNGSSAIAPAATCHGPCRPSTSSRPSHTGT